jgi:hypothetical protein
MRKPLRVYYTHIHYYLNCYYFSNKYLYMVFIVYVHVLL